MSNAAIWRERAERPAGGSLPRWARPALLTLSVLCALGLAGRFIAEPLMTIHHLNVQSDVPLADDQVLALSGIQAGEHWYTIATAAIEKRLEANPLIRQARVERVFPDTVRLTVWGRQPVALLLAASGGRTLPVLVDGDGVVYRQGASRGDLDVPVISGVMAGSMAFGARLPAAYLSLFSDLRTLKAKAPDLYAQLSEVRVIAATPDAAAQTAQGFDLLLYLTSSPVPVLTRATLDDSVLKYTLMVVDLLSRQGILKDIQELDFRSGDVVYRIGSASTATNADAASAPATVAASAPATVATNAPATVAANAPSTSARNGG
jgi:cell division protein FtsQ